jgi:type VI protein secretion system component VasF
MASAEPSAPSASAPRVRNMSITRRVSFWGFATLVVLAVALYVWWGVAFGVWIDNGEYAVVITLLLFGLAGMWLVLPNPPAPPAPPP